MKLTLDQLKEIRERVGTRLAAHGFALPENKDVLELLDHIEELEREKGNLKMSAKELRKALEFYAAFIANTNGGQYTEPAREYKENEICHDVLTFDCGRVAQLALTNSTWPQEEVS